MNETGIKVKPDFLFMQSRGLAMTVNTPRPNFLRPTPVSLSGQRLYLREEELDSGIARFLSVVNLMKEVTQNVRQTHDLTWTSAHMLVTLLRAPKGVADLGTILGMTKQNAIKTAEDLETRGLLSRQTDPRDARRRPLALTPSGQDIAREIASAMRAPLASAYRQVGGEAVSGSDAVLAALIKGKRS
jgi:DNA-binding MarR family transcriptional regulator